MLRSTYTLARLLPMLISPLCGFIRRTRNAHSPKKIRAGTTQDSRSENHVFSTRPEKRTFAASSSGTSPGSSTRAVMNRCIPWP